LKTALLNFDYFQIEIAMDPNQAQQQQFYAQNGGYQQQYQPPPAAQPQQYWAAQPPPPPPVQQQAAPIQRNPPQARPMFDFQLRSDVREIRDSLRELLLMLHRGSGGTGQNNRRRRPYSRPKTTGPSDKIEKGDGNDGKGNGPSGNAGGAGTAAV
jgi:hypothetical protein